VIPHRDYRNVLVQGIVISSPREWKVDTSYLYKLEVTLLSCNKTGYIQSLSKVSFHRLEIIREMAVLRNREFRSAVPIDMIITQSWVKQSSFC